MERWSGRVGIVTGASSGIGAAIARLLVKQGMRVVGVAREADCHAIQKVADELKQLEVKGELHAVPCDVTKEGDVVCVVKWARDNLGGTDVLVNNAGVNFTGLLTEITSSAMRTMLETNVLGLCMFTREVIKDMRSRGVDDGHIVHICSATGQRILEYPGIAVYSSSKHAVRVLTEGLRRELRDMGTKIKITVTWIKAEEICTDLGMQLLTMETEERWTKIKNFIYDNSVYDYWWWTSARKPLDTEDWSWSTTGSELSYSMWFPNQPSNNALTDDSCMQLNAGNQFSPSGWDDARCVDAITPYICEFPA